MRRFRILTALLASLLMLAALMPAAGAAPMSSAGLKTATILVNGQAITAYNLNGRTVAPFRAILEALGAEVGWDQATRTAIATKGNLVIKMPIDSDTAYINEDPVKLEVSALLIDSRTFVPVRFLGESMGAKVEWNQEAQAVTISFDDGCTLAGGQEHTGLIADTGETWGLCGSPHFVTGEFRVEGKMSPVLTIEPGAMVRFAAGASLVIGDEAPGGLVAEGTADQPITFTGDMLNPQPGYWHGIYFGDQSIRGKSILENVKVQYAGTDYWQNGAIWVDGADRPVEISLKNVTISNAYQTGLNLFRQARLSTDSTNLSVIGTVAANENGGFPIQTSIYGSNSLPTGGKFENNAVNGVFVDTVDSQYVSANTTWRNLGIPYLISDDIYVNGAQSPKLTIEPGVTTLWRQDTTLWVGWEGPGSLVADAMATDRETGTVARPEGGGEWRSATNEDLTTALQGLVSPATTAGKAWPANYLGADKVQQLASQSRMADPMGCALCGSPAITFGAWTNEPTRGFWGGIVFGENAGTKSVINGAVIAYGGASLAMGETRGNITMYSYEKPVSLTLKNSVLADSSYAGLHMWGKSSLTSGSAGNTAVGNNVPVRGSADAVMSIEAWNGLTGNDKDMISLLGDGDDYLSQTGVWGNHGVPYYIPGMIYTADGTDPVLTIEPGSTLIFKNGAGFDFGTGAMVAKGTAGKPITFTGENKRPGAWNGISLGEATGDSQFDYVTIEYANTALYLGADFGSIIKNTTIRSSAEMGIYRGWGAEGTDFLTGFGNRFEGNNEDMNVE